jgi:hypothetical protein
MEEFVPFPSLGLVEETKDWKWGARTVYFASRADAGIQGDSTKAQQGRLASMMLIASGDSSA